MKSQSVSIGHFHRDLKLCREHIMQCLIILQLSMCKSFFVCVCVCLCGLTLKVLFLFLSEAKAGSDSSKLRKHAVISEALQNIFNCMFFFIIY